MIYNSQAEGCVIALVRRLCHWTPRWLLLCTGKKWIIFTLSTIMDYLEVFDDLELFQRLHCWVVESTFLIDDLNFRTFLSGRWRWTDTGCHPGKTPFGKSEKISQECETALTSWDHQMLRPWTKVFEIRFILLFRIISALWNVTLSHSGPQINIIRFGHFAGQPYDYEGVKCEGIILHVATCRNIKLEAR